jgi:hypothetical protein
MEGSTNTLPQRLVHVRGGSQMLFTALCVSLPEDAQHLLSVFLWVIPFFTLYKVPLTTTAAVRRGIRLLFVRAVMEVADKHPVASQPQTSVWESQLLSTLTQFMLRCLRYTQMTKLVTSLFGSTMQDSIPADHLAALTDAVLCKSVLAAAGQSIPARSPASQRALSSPSDARVCAALFATTTTAALSSYLHHVLSRAAHQSVTLYVPGLLTAPWTTHLTPLLHRVQRQHGAQVVGYDVELNAHRYEVNLDHLHKLVQDRDHRAGNSSVKTTVFPRSRPTATTAAAASLPAAATTTAVLFLASVRGRCPHNCDKAFELAKSQRWHVVELCVPTLPLPAATQIAGTNRVTATATHLVLPIIPDVRITSFDDAGMYGGAVVHLCVSDARLIARMTSECQVGFPEIRSDVGRADTPEKTTGVRSVQQSSHRSATGAMMCSLPSSAIAATTDLTTRSSEYLKSVWVPWASRLRHALQQEAATSLHRVAKMQQSVTASSHSVVEALTSLPATTLQRVTGWPPSSARALQSGKRVPPTGGAEYCEDSSGQKQQQRVTADTTVEQRTTVITQPLPPLDLVSSAAAPQTPRKRESGAPTEEGTAQPQNGLWSFSTSREEGGALTSWMLRLSRQETAVAAAEEAPANTPAEWRIRLRWTALLLSTYTGGVAVAEPSSGRPTPSRDVCTAAYVSLWSCVAQLPPWVGAVSAENEASLRRVSSGCVDNGDGSDCVEVAATALLVRVAYPASARAVAQLLRDETAVDARAVVSRAWDDADKSTTTASPPARVSPFLFEEALVMPGCTHAAALADELLYIPLTLFMDTGVRDAVLRVLWEKVPHAHDTVETLRRTDGAPNGVLANLNAIYRTYLAAEAAAASHTMKTMREAGKVQYRPLRLRSSSSTTDVTPEEAHRAQQLLFRRAMSWIAAAAAPPSFVSNPGASLAALLKGNVIPAVSSKL